MVFEVDGIKYNENKDGRTVRVIRKYFKKYEGEVVIPSSVEYNGNEYSVTEIGWDAFSGCSGLTSVVIPDSVTEIGSKAFAATPFYTNHPDGVVYLGKVLYKYKGKMPNDTKLIIKEGTVSIAPCAFDGCSGLTSVVIPDSVTEIGEDAFSGCSGLTSVIIPDSVTKIGKYALSGCSGLRSVVIPNSVMYIDNYAFSGCSGLTNVVIPDSVKIIGPRAFADCSGLTNVVIPDSVTEIDRDAFDGCSGLESIVVENGNQVYDSRDNCNAIIETKTNELIIGCKNTIITNSVTKIRIGAFADCRGLTSVVIPDSVTEIGYRAFMGCRGLTSVVIPDSVTWIGGSAFAGCSGLTSIVIPDSVTVIGGSAFAGCSGLTSIVIPDSVTVIGGSAFAGCSGLTSIVIPDSVTEIGAYAFEDCSGLTSIVIPDSVTEIGECAFKGCSSLISVVIPDSVTEVGESAFEDCSGLESIIVDKNNPKNDSRGNCNAIIETKTNKLISGCKNTIIPDSITEIGGGAFGGCIGLTSVVIPNSVTWIGDWAFSGCSGLTTLFYNVESDQSMGIVCGCDNLNTIVIGEIVKYIPKELFNAVSLRSIILLAQEPPKCEMSISKKNNITVHVPKDAYVKYWLDDYWRDFNLCEFVPVDGINISRQDIYLGLNYKDKLSVTISPINATHKEVIWKSDNPSVITVDQSGNVCGVSRGAANIIVEALDGSGVKAMCKVRVGEILADSVVVTPSSLMLERNKFANINCCVLPENTHNKAVEWSTTDDDVVAFRKNRDGSISVIGVSAGSAKILCKALDGGGACGVCDITVENR